MIADHSYRIGDNNLGKVRTEMVKRTARELIERFPGKFTNEYEANKSAVNEVLIAPSKKLRNRIAGYVTRLKVTEAQKATMMQMSPEAQLGLGEGKKNNPKKKARPQQLRLFFHRALDRRDAFSLLHALTIYGRWRSDHCSDLSNLIRDCSSPIIETTLLPDVDLEDMQLDLDHNQQSQAILLYVTKRMARSK